MEIPTVRLLAVRAAEDWARVCLVLHCTVVVCWDCCPGGGGGTAATARQPARHPPSPHHTRLLGHQVPSRPVLCCSLYCSLPGLQDLLAQLQHWGDTHPDTLVTHVFPLDRAEQAYRYHRHTDLWRLES